VKGTGLRLSSPHAVGTHRLGALVGAPVVPARVDRRPAVVEVLDQALTNSCAAHAVGQGIRCAQNRTAPGIDVPWLLSRRALYRAARVLSDGGLGNDNGTTFEAVFSVLGLVGFGPERAHPWDADRAATLDGPAKQAWLDEEPPFTAMREAGDRRAFKGVARLDVGPTLPDAARFAIAGGADVVIGLVVDDAFEQAAGPTLVRALGASSGLHAMLLCGYEPDGSFHDVNSWGAGWRDGGFCRLAESLIADGDRLLEAWAIDARVGGPS
jgi:hypothetical protein